jgi:hypothetical protein
MHMRCWHRGPRCWASFSPEKRGTRLLILICHRYFGTKRSANGRMRSTSATCRPPPCFRSTAQQQLPSPMMMMSEASSASHEDLFQEAEACVRWPLGESGQSPDLPRLAQMTPDQINFLEGGVDAATYLVKRPNGDVVVHLNRDGLEAEARALLWRQIPATAPNARQLCTSRFQSSACGLVSTAVV